MTLTKTQQEWLLKTCSGKGKIELDEANWYDTTLCLSSKVHRSQVDSDHVYREYKILVRLLHNENKELFYIDVCDMGSNVLDQWPDNPNRYQLILNNTGCVINLFNDIGYPIDTRVRYYD